jgi:hypothetical protein
LVLCYDCPCFWFNYKNNIHLVLILSLLSFFFSCLSEVKRLVALLLLCRISRALSFLVCLMMTCTRTQGIRIQADDARIHKRVYRRHCHLCRCCIHVCMCVSSFTLFFFLCNEVWRRDVRSSLSPQSSSHALFTYIQSMSFILHALFSNEWMYFDDNSRLQLQQLPHHQLTSRERAACIIELIATHAFVLFSSVSYTLPPAVRMRPNSIGRTIDTELIQHTTHIEIDSFACLQCLIVLISKPPGIHIHIHTMLRIFFRTYIHRPFLHLYVYAACHVFSSITSRFIHPHTHMLAMPFHSFFFLLFFSNTTCYSLNGHTHIYRYTYISTVKSV